MVRGGGRGDDFVHALERDRGLARRSAALVATFNVVLGVAAGLIEVPAEAGDVAFGASNFVWDSFDY